MGNLYAPPILFFPIPLKKKVLKELLTLLHPSRAPKPSPIGVGVSGGGDSLALLHLLLEAGWEPGDLYVIHLNHKKRMESEEEAEFVRHMSASLGVPFLYAVYTGTRYTPEALREFRLERFRAFAREHALNLIALAHTLNDQIETRILALLRGSGLKGISGIKAYDPPFWRPLLEVTREELRSYLRERNLPYREDPGNLDPSHPRALVRHLLLPALGRAPLHEALRIRILKEEDRYLDTLALEELLRVSQGWCLSVPGLLRLPSPLLRRVLRLYLPEDTPLERVEGVLKALYGNRSAMRLVQLKHREEVLIGTHYLLLITGIPRTPVHLKPGETLSWGRLGTLTCREKETRILPGFLVPALAGKMPGEVRFAVPVQWEERSPWFPRFPWIEEETSPDENLLWKPALFEPSAKRAP